MYPPCTLNGLKYITEIAPFFFQMSMWIYSSTILPSLKHFYLRVSSALIIFPISPKTVVIISHVKSEYLSSGKQVN